MVKPVNVQPISKPVSQQPTGPSAAQKAQQSGSDSFAEKLAQQSLQAQQSQGLTFSKHAQNRLENRQINLTDEGIARLEAAVNKAEKRGGQESLILMDDMAFIVNVKNRMVVTAMDATKRGEGVFTNIDSVVLADTSANTEGEKKGT